MLLADAAIVIEVGFRHLHIRFGCTSLTGRKVWVLDAGLTRGAQVVAPDISQRSLDRVVEFAVHQVAKSSLDAYVCHQSVRVKVIAPEDFDVDIISVFRLSHELALLAFAGWDL